MEFKFRAVDDRPPPPPPPPQPPPPIFNSFSEQPFLGQRLPPPANFTPSSLPNVHSGSPFGDFRPYWGPSRYPNEFRGLTTVLELERERLREEIILAEIARRRELENEVRREIMLLEREIAMRREVTSEGSLLLEDRWARMRYSSPRVPMVDSFDDHLALSSRPTVLDNIAPEINNSSSEPNKEKLIVLAKPDPNSFGAKRKAVTPPTVDANELHPFGLKKKPKEEWSCALCQVTATSEKGLNQHLQGRKHKAREAGLVSQKVGKSAINVPLTKKTKKSSKPTQTGGAAIHLFGVLTGGAACSKSEAIVEGKPPLLQRETGYGLNKENEDLTSKLEVVIQELKNTGELDKNNGSETLQTADGNTEQKTTKKTKIYKFWCETCQVGSQSSKVMEDHKRGKKHSARIRVCEPTKSEIAHVATTIISSEAVFEKPKEANVEDQIEKPKEANVEDQSEIAHVATKIISSEAVFEKPKEANVEDQIEKPEEANVEDQVEKPKEANVEDQVERPEEANVEDQVEKPEEPNVEDQVEKPEEANVEDQVEKPEEPSVEDQANEKKITDGVPNTDESNLTPEA